MAKRRWKPEQNLLADKSIFNDKPDTRAQDLAKEVARQRQEKAQEQANQQARSRQTVLQKVGNILSAPGRALADKLYKPPADLTPAQAAENSKRASGLAGNMAKTAVSTIKNYHTVDNLKKTPGVAADVLASNTMKALNTGELARKQIISTGRMKIAEMTKNPEAFRSANEASQRDYENLSNKGGLRNKGTFFKDAKEAQSGELKTGLKRIGGGMLGTATEVVPFARGATLAKPGMKLGQAAKRLVVENTAYGAAGSVGSQLMNKDRVDAKEVLRDVAISNALGAVGYGATRGGRGIDDNIPRSVYRGAPKAEAPSFVTPNKKMAKEFAEETGGTLQKYGLKPKDVLDVTKPGVRDKVVTLVGRDKADELFNKTPSKMFSPEDETVAREIADKLGYKTVRFDERNIGISTPDTIAKKPYSVGVIDSSALKGQEGRLPSSSIGVRPGISAPESPRAGAYGGVSPEAGVPAPTPRIGTTTTATSGLDVSSPTSIAPDTMRPTNPVDIKTPPQATQALPETAPLQPIGAGATKTSKLSSSVQQKAVDKKLTETLGTLPEYKQVNMADQARKATELLDMDEQTAIKIATGEAVPPADILPESVFTAVENKAIKDGNVEVLRKLATGTRGSEATAMGQRIRALAERDPDSAVTRIRELAMIRREVAERRLGKPVDKALQETTGAIRNSVKKTSKTDWGMFVESIKC